MPFCFFMTSTSVACSELRNVHRMRGSSLKWTLTICWPAFDKQVSEAHPAISSLRWLSQSAQRTAKPSSVVNDPVLSAI
jgi:hypothetical protein